MGRGQPAQEEDRPQKERAPAGDGDLVEACFIGCKLYAWQFRHGGFGEERPREDHLPDHEYEPNEVNRSVEAERDASKFGLERGATHLP